MPFIIPDTAKPISEGSAKIYKRYLNRLFDYAGNDEITNVEKVIEYDEVIPGLITMITSHIEDAEKRKHEARVYYSALFWVLYNHPYLKKKDNPLRKGFHENDPAKTTDGKVWVKIVNSTK